ncbi:hypothetical protein [Candidatus Contendibacter odensensis]|uniref:DUF2281 domain-containing protein n=1 Tax=Candidatus Contendobacter odensis Run_B_J11 TaxID=1400861 RepID=A0A7U7G8F8_9GAMM|nr:conserved hypothetical protein [Candidatus Contendobacter odensis Run_B_J11]
MPTQVQDNRETMWQQRIMSELRNIPEPKLAELYDLIHYFRLGLTQPSAQPRQPGLLHGQLGAAFFEPLPDEELRAWE